MTTTPKDSNEIRVLLIDDHPIISTGVEHILKKTTGQALIATASSGAEGIEKAKHLNPGVILLDVNLPDMSGITVAKKILNNEPKSKILALTTLSHPSYPVQLLRIGVKGYLIKNNTEDLPKAINLVHQGQHYLPHKISEQIAVAGKKTYLSGRFSSLSKRETEVVLKVLSGKSVAEIAEELYIDRKTVHTYRGRVFNKLNIKNDVEMTVLAIQDGFLEITPLASEEELEGI